MKSFTFTLNVEVLAQDIDEALEIAKVIKQAAYLTPYKYEIEINDLEEL